jgi:hypothetical protein
MRGVVELAKNQLGGLIFGDGLITAGTIPDHLGLFFVQLSFEQRCLTYVGDVATRSGCAVALPACAAPADRSAKVVCGDVLFPVALAHPQFPACRLERLDCGNVAGSFGSKARQMVPCTEVFGERLCSRFDQAFQFQTIA